MISIKLKEVIKDTGKIDEQYGGFEILVLDKEKFPWTAVFQLLIESGFQIWVKKKNSYLEINSKPEVG